MRINRKRLALGLGLLVLLTALGATRLYRLDAPSLWEDDYLNLDRAMMPLAAMFAVQKYQGPADTIFDFQPPLMYALEHLALDIHRSSLAARIPSVLAALLTPLGLWLLGRRLFGPAVGLTAAVLTVFLLYPLGFSQAIKAYALLLCLAVYSLWLVAKAVDDGRVSSWIAYGACTLGMLYAGYQGLPTFAVQCLWAGAVIWREPGREPGARRRRLLRFLATCAVLGAAYLPWLPAIFFIREFLRDPSVHPWARLDLAFAAKILRGFISLDPDMPAGYVLAWVAALVLGTWRCLQRRQRRGLCLLGLTAAVTSLALVSSHSLLRPILEARHFVMAFPALVLLAAGGVVFLSDGVGRTFSRMRVGRAVGAGTGVLACLLLLWPSLSGYGDFYNRALSQDREFFQWLDEGRGDVDALEFHGYKRNTRRFAARWYLPGRFGEAGTFAGPGYRRIVDIDSFYTDAADTRPRLPGLTLKEFASLFTTTRVTLAPAASRAPLVMDPGPDGGWRYGDDFRHGRFYADALCADNMTLDTELGMLRPARYSRPGQATWEFEVPPGVDVSRLRLGLTAVLYKRHPTLPADAILTVAAGPDETHLTDLGVIGQEAFPLKAGRPVEVERAFFDEMGFYHERCREAKLEYVVPPPLAAGGRLFVRVSYRPGLVEGFLNLAGLELSADLRRVAPARPEDAPLVLSAKHLLENVRAARWSEADAGRAIGLFAFAAPGFENLAAAGLPVGTPGQREAFLQEHPGLEPVTTLSDRDGRVALFLYDPTLDQPGIPLSARTPSRRVLGLPPFGHGPASLRLTGTIAAPTLHLGNQTLSLPVLAPRGSTLTLTPGGRGRLYFVPDWTDVGHFTEAMSYSRALAPSKRLRGELTCQGEGDCAFAYTFVSAFPVTALRLKTFPQVYANPCRKCESNQAKVSVSTDGGKSWRRLVDETGGEECTWTPPGRYVIRRLTFKRPVTSFLLSFELGQGGQAGFLSPSWNVDGMYVEADLNVSALPPLHLSGPDLDVSLADPGQNDFRLFLRPGPWPLSDRTAEP